MWAGFRVSPWKIFILFIEICAFWTQMKFTVWFVICSTTAIYRNLPLTIQTCECRLVVIIALQTAVSSRQFCQWCCRPLENSSPESSTYEAVVRRWREETLISWYSTTVQCSILTSGIKPQRTGRWQSTAGRFSCTYVKICTNVYHQAQRHNICMAYFRHCGGLRW